MHIHDQQATGRASSASSERSDAQCNPIPFQVAGGAIDQTFSEGEDARWWALQKRYDDPQTPVQRLLNWQEIKPEHREWIEEQLAPNNPFELSREVDARRLSSPEQTSGSFNACDVEGERERAFSSIFFYASHTSCSRTA